MQQTRESDADTFAPIMENIDEFKLTNFETVRSLDNALSRKTGNLGKAIFPPFFAHLSQRTDRQAYSHSDTELRILNWVRKSGMELTYYVGNLDF